MKPDPHRLALGVRNEGLVKVPRSVRGGSVALEGDEGSRIADHPAVQVWVQPRHRERGSGAGTHAERRTTFGIRCERHLVILGDTRQQFRLDEVRVAMAKNAKISGAPVVSTLP